MKRKNPRRANGEGFGDHRADDDRSLTAIAPGAQIPRILRKHFWRGEALA